MSSTLNLETPVAVGSLIPLEQATPKRVKFEISPQTVAILAHVAPVVNTPNVWFKFMSGDLNAINRAFGAIHNHKKRLIASGNMQCRRNQNGDGTYYGYVRYLP